MSAPDSEAQGRIDSAGRRAEAAGAAARPVAGRRARRRLFAQPRAGADHARAPSASAASRRRARAASSQAGEHVAIDLPEPEPAEPEGEDIPLDILYEDDDLIVINKPAGLVVHPGAGNWTGTLVNALIHHCGDSLSGIGGVKRPGIVHRLDKDTSGVMVVAKTDRAHRGAVRQPLPIMAAPAISSAPTRRWSGALPERSTGTVDAPLGRAGDRVRRAVVPASRDDARHAVTHYQVMRALRASSRKPIGASLVECRLETGRTHQIRVHMAHIGHPLIGDPDYGAGFPHQGQPPARAAAARRCTAFRARRCMPGCLHFAIPHTHIMMRFEAPMPADMAAIWSTNSGR